MRERVRERAKVNFSIPIRPEFFRPFLLSPVGRICSFEELEDFLAPDFQTFRFVSTPTISEVYECLAEFRKKYVMDFEVPLITTIVMGSFSVEEINLVLGGIRTMLEKSFEVGWTDRESPKNYVKVWKSVRREVGTRRQLRFNLQEFQAENLSYYEEIRTFRAAITRVILEYEHRALEDFQPVYGMFDNFLSRIVEKSLTSNERAFLSALLLVEGGKVDGKCREHSEG